MSDKQPPRQQTTMEGFASVHLQDKLLSGNSMEKAFASSHLAAKLPDAEASAASSTSGSASTASQSDFPSSSDNSKPEAAD